MRNWHIDIIESYKGRSEKCLSIVSYGTMWLERWGNVLMVTVVRQEEEILLVRYRRENESRKRRKKTGNRRGIYIEHAIFSSEQAISCLGALCWSAEPAMELRFT